MHWYTRTLLRFWISLCFQLCHAPPCEFGVGSQQNLLGQLLQYQVLE